MNFQPKLKEVEMKNMVKNICAAMVISLCAAGHLSATENNPNNDNKFMEENLNLIQVWGIERSGFFNGREKWAKGFENQRV